MPSPAESFEHAALAHGRFVPHPDGNEMLWCATQYGHLPDLARARRALIEDARGTERLTAERAYTVEGERLVITRRKMSE